MIRRRAPIPSPLLAAALTIPALDLLDVRYTRRYFDELVREQYPWMYAKPGAK